MFWPRVLEGFATRNDLVHIGRVGGQGAMIAFDVLGAESAPEGARAKQICANVLSVGLLLLSCGQHGQTIRILVPLTAADDVVDEGFDLLGLALARAESTDLLVSDLV